MKRILLIAIPLFLFSIVFPNFESGIQASSNSGFVLGAYTENKSVAEAKSVDNADALTDPNPEVQSQIKAQPAAYQTTNGTEPLLSAKSVLVYDLKTNQIIFEKEGLKKLPIASLTKLMTAAVVLKEPDYNKEITITQNDKLPVAPYLHLVAGDSVKPSDLLRSMIVGSANDAASALGNHFPDKENFVNKMNSMAVQLEMVNTHFSNPTGFDSDQNYSTAEDLQKLTDYALKNLPYSEIWQTKNYSFVSSQGNRYSVRNSSSLAFTLGIKNIKTGLSPEALGNMIALREDAQGDQLVTIILGSQDRDRDTLLITDYIFKNFTWQ